MPLADQLDSLVRRTPLVFAPELGVHLKLESLQRTGSFKLRGAVEACRRLSAEQIATGVVVASAGNHGAGMALACWVAGVALRVVVPEGTPVTKRQRIESAGASIIVHADNYDDADAYARELACADGAVFISAFDDDGVMSGNGGSLAEEIRAQLPSVSSVVLPVGGGGMIAGLSRVLAPAGVTIIGAQPERNCAMHESLAVGRALTGYRGRPTVAKGCEGAVGALAFDVARPHIARTALVSEEAIEAAVAYAYRQLGLVIECSGAVALAAIREGALDADPGVVCVVSGGNIDDDELARILLSQPAAIDR